MKQRAGCRVAAALALATCVATAGARAGTGRLDSSWMPYGPWLDGSIEPERWGDATVADLGGGVTVWIGNDARTLYLAVRDEGDATLSWGDMVYLHFDDEGGASPILDDGDWTNPACQSSPTLGEGVLFIKWDGTIDYSEWWRNGLSIGFCEVQNVTGRAHFAAATSVAGVEWEIAIPLDGPMPLRAAASRRFAVWIRVQRGESGFAGCLPTACGNVDPADYRNVVLSSFGCNRPAVEFGGALPIDWNRAHLQGAGDGWAPTTGGGDPEACASNVTGGAGVALCVGTGDQEGPFVAVVSPPPFTLRHPAEAELRFLANFQALGAPLEGFGVESSIDGGGNWTTELVWEESHGDPDGPGEAVALDLASLLGEADAAVRFSTGSSLGGILGGFAQVDAVELRCSPDLFHDNFETGLTTRWSATSP